MDANVTAHWSSFRWTFYWLLIVAAVPPLFAERTFDALPKYNSIASVARDEANDGDRDLPDGDVNSVILSHENSGDQPRTQYDNVYDRGLPNRRPIADAGAGAGRNSIRRLKPTPALQTRFVVRQRFVDDAESWRPSDLVDAPLPPAVPVDGSAPFVVSPSIYPASRLETADGEPGGNDVLLSRPKFRWSDESRQYPIGEEPVPTYVATPGSAGILIARRDPGFAIRERQRRLLMQIEQRRRELELEQQRGTRGRSSGESGDGDLRQNFIDATSPPYSSPPANSVNNRAGFKLAMSRRLPSALASAIAEIGPFGTSAPADPASAMSSGEILAILKGRGAQRSAAGGQRQKAVLTEPSSESTSAETSPRVKQFFETSMNTEQPERPRVGYFHQESREIDETQDSRYSRMDQQQQQQQQPEDLIPAEVAEKASQKQQAEESTVVTDRKSNDVDGDDGESLDSELDVAKNYTAFVKQLKIFLAIFSRVLSAMDTENELQDKYTGAAQIDNRLSRRADRRSNGSGGQRGNLQFMLKTSANRKRSHECMRKCLRQKLLHPAQCHTLC